MCLWRKRIWGKEKTWWMFKSLVNNRIAGPAHVLPDIPVCSDWGRGSWRRRMCLLWGESEWSHAGNCQSHRPQGGDWSVLLFNWVRFQGRDQILQSCLKSVCERWRGELGSNEEICELCSTCRCGRHEQVSQKLQEHQPIGLTAIVLPFALWTGFKLPHSSMTCNIYFANLLSLDLSPACIKPGAGPAAE